jgi:hypothetical protein
MTRAVLRALLWVLIFAGQLAVCLALAAVARSLIAGRPSLDGEVRVPPPAARPQLSFACEMDTPELQSLFANPDVLRDLRRLNAEISLALIDLSPGRAQVVHTLNAAGIAVTAGLLLPKEQGYYLNSVNASQAVQRFADIQKWTANYGLRWSRVGLDIEPSLQEFEAARHGSLPDMAASIFRRLLDPGTVRRARTAYSELISRIDAAGYRVETYQFPFIADERAVNSTLLERLFGIVDVPAGREVLMLYSSFNHRADSAVIWQYGPSAQIIVVGTTSGDNQPGSKYVPLSFEELEHDLIVAAHFSPVVGIYNLEASVRRGFLPPDRSRLEPEHRHFRRFEPPGHPASRTDPIRALDPGSPSLRRLRDSFRRCLVRRPPPPEQYSGPESPHVICTTVPITQIIHGPTHG